MNDYPQVILFGAIGGGWREQWIIPVLDELGVTYYNPIQEDGWTPEAGDREADVMAHCETIVMVINKTSPAFTSLAEAGWAALGAVQRRQHFILQIDLDYTYPLPDSILQIAEGQRLQAWLQHWVSSSRYLVYKHAQQFNIPTMHLVTNMEDVIGKLREIYQK